MFYLDFCDNLKKELIAIGNVHTMLKIRIRRNNYIYFIVLYLHAHVSMGCCGI